jgi:hypothetical protein
MAAFDSAHAQWVPPRGEGSVSIEYQNFSTTDHVWSDLAHARGIPPEHDDNEVTGSVIVMSLDYAVYDRLALNITLPFIHTKFEAGDIYAAGSGSSHRVDIGSNNAFQDLGVGLRYMAMTDPFLVTTSIGMTWPTHDYGTHGHSAIGTNLKTLSVGAGLARSLHSILPGVYVTGDYSYLFSEGARGIRPNRSNVTVGVSYSPSHSISLSTYWYQRIAHGGIEWSDLAFPTSDLFDVHDQIGAESFGQISGGISYSLTHRLGIYAGAYKLIESASENTNKTQGISIGTTTSF